MSSTLRQQQQQSSLLALQTRMQARVASMQEARRCTAQVLPQQGRLVQSAVTKLQVQGQRQPQHQHCRRCLLLLVAN
jgi:hypothetical protein